jgi:hypothetical protein
MMMMMTTTMMMMMLMMLSMMMMLMGAVMMVMFGRHDDGDVLCVVVEFCYVCSHLMSFIQLKLGPVSFRICLVAFRSGF